MRVSSPRKPCNKKHGALPVLALAAISSHFAIAKDLLDLAYAARFTSRAALHLNAPVDEAMHRHTLDFEQTVKGGSWSGVFGARAYAEGAFAMNTGRYNAPVRSIESQEFTPRDVYIQYKGSGFQLRVGAQQVVWGESYGFFFADIVNPKDTREFGLGGDLTAQRITIPIANLIWFLGEQSLQFIYIPKPFLNMTPAQGNDFSFPISQFFPGMNVSVVDDRILPLTLANSEFGIRATTLWKGWDLSLFYLSYFDRRPSYRPTITGTNVDIHGKHDPINSIGLTGTKDLDTWVARFELVYNHQRPVDAYYQDLVNPQLSFYSALSDEFIWVLGFDYTQWRDWRFSVQLSQDSYFKNVPGAFLRQNSANLAVILGGTLFHNHELNLISSYSPDDGSGLFQLSYMVPLSSRLEATIGAYLFEGTGSSQYGQFKNANRAFVMLRGYFGKE